MAAALASSAEQETAVEVEGETHDSEPCTLTAIAAAYAKPAEQGAAVECSRESCSFDLENCLSAGPVYEIIDGDVYNQDLLKKAQDEADSAPGALLSLDSAKSLWTSLGEEGSNAALLEANLRTIGHIMRVHRMDVMAKTFLQESMKLARHMGKKQARLDKRSSAGSPDKRCTAAASPDTRSSPTAPGTVPKRSKSMVDPFREIQRIEQEIAEAKTLSQMKRAQSELKRWKIATQADPAKPVRIKCNFKVIDGKRYDADILAKAEAEVAKKGGRDLRLKVAKKLWMRAESATEGDGIAPPQRRSLEYILEELEVSEKAHDFLDSKLKLKSAAQTAARAAVKAQRRGTKTKLNKEPSDAAHRSEPCQTNPLTPPMGEALALRRRFRYKRPASGEELGKESVYSSPPKTVRRRIIDKSAPPDWAKR